MAAAQARGETVSLYTPPAQTPQAAKPFTGFELEQRPAQARPMADSFLQIDRCAACLCSASTDRWVKDVCTPERCICAKNISLHHILSCLPSARRYQRAEKVSHCCKSRCCRDVKGCQHTFSTGSCNRKHRHPTYLGCETLNPPRQQLR